jgi:glycine hydroxymethyltransferase
VTGAQGPNSLEEVDPEVAALIGAELERQRRTLDMVASQNVVPQAVLGAQGSILTNKYADGYPAKRDYDGCEVVDDVERLAIDRARELFGADHANVQPYSGSSANAAVLHALCKPGDVILGFDFNHGGHPTHYAPETFAGRFYDAFAYHVDRATGLVDMEEVASLAEQHRPRVIFAGWSCYPRFLDFAAFREIADRHGSALVVDMAHFAGLVAAKVHPDPVPFADVCTMTVHKTLGGARGGAILCRSELAEAIDEAVYPGEQGCPLMHVIAAKAVTYRLAGTPEFKERMERTVAGARTVAGVIAAASGETGASLLTGGTDVHQVLVELPDGEDQPDGPTVQLRLNEIGITCNAIRAPYDTRREPSSSALRLGTAALATRGFGPAQFAEVGEIVVGALGESFVERREELAGRVSGLLAGFPIY